MNYTGKLNLMKFKNACLVSVKGRTETKKGIFIPIEDNHVFVSADEANRVKGAYVSFLAFEGMEKGRYGDTHSMKQTYPSEIRRQMTEEELKSVPYIGNMRPFESLSASDRAVVEAQANPQNREDDLPF